MEDARPDGASAGTATLADVGGLRPCDTVGLGIHQLRELVREASGAAALDQHDPPGPAIVRALAAALAGTPALTDDVDAAADTVGAAATELAQRYTRVRDAAAAAATDARTSAAPAATENARRRALVRMARWGITPLAEGSTLAERLVRAAEVLERRIAEAPATPEGATVEVIAGAIGALVSPEVTVPGLRTSSRRDVRRPARRAGERGSEATTRSRLAGDSGSGAAGARPARGGPAPAAARNRRPAATRLDEPPRRPVADRAAAAL